MFICVTQLFDVIVSNQSSNHRQCESMLYLNALFIFYVCLNIICTRWGKCIVAVVKRSVEGTDQLMRIIEKVEYKVLLKWDLTSEIGRGQPRLGLQQPAEKKIWLGCSAYG